MFKSVLIFICVLVLAAAGYCLYVYLKAERRKAAEQANAEAWLNAVNEMQAETTWEPGLTAIKREMDYFERKRQQYFPDGREVVIKTGPLSTPKQGGGYSVTKETKLF